MSTSPTKTRPRAEILAELKKTKNEIARIKEDPDGYGMEYTQEIVDKLFSTYQKGKIWLDKVRDQATTRGWVMSPIGRRRNLYRVFTGKRKFIADAGRRAQNSPIQGISSEYGCTTGLLCVYAMDKYCREFDIPEETFMLYCRAVHDANEFEIPYELVIPAAHIMNYEATYGAVAYYEKVFGMKFNVEPEIEIEINARGDESYKWDWSLPNLLEKCIFESLTDAVEIDLIRHDEGLDVWNKITAPWRSKAKRTYLLDNWPLLNRADLHDEIRAAVAAADKKVIPHFQAAEVKPKPRK